MARSIACTSAASTAASPNSPAIVGERPEPQRAGPIDRLRRQRLQQQIDRTRVRGNQHKLADRLGDAPASIRTIGGALEVLRHRFAGSRAGERKVPGTPIEIALAVGGVAERLVRAS